VSKNLIAQFDSVALGSASIKLAIVVVHFKAIPTDPASCAQREAQATVTRSSIVTLANAGAHLSLYHIESSIAMISAHGER
jgi:hypothetical protein